MLHTLNDLEDFSLHATDGIISKVKDFYVDDRRWVVRFIVVEVGSLLKSHKVLLSPAIVKHVNREDKSLIVDLSISEIMSSPHIDSARSPSQQYEIDYLSYYGYAFYWGNNSLWDSLPSSGSDTSVKADRQEKNSKTVNTFAAVDTVRRMYGDRHLRSCVEILGYHIQAQDGEIGHLQNLLVNEGTWAIEYLIASTSNWWAGKQVLISPQVIKDISWGDAKVHVDMTQNQIQSAPLFDPQVPVNKQKEMGVYLHYDRSGYSEVESKAQRAS